MPQTFLHEKENQSVVYKVPAKNIETEKTSLNLYKSIAWCKYSTCFGF